MSVQHMGPIVCSEASSRVKITDGVVQVTIEIPTKRNWFVILFLGFWRCGWAAGELMVPTKLLTGSDPKAPAAFMLAWLGGWTIAGAAAITIFVWMLAGRETELVAPVRRDLGVATAPEPTELSTIARMSGNAHYTPDPSVACCVSWPIN